MIAIAAWSRVLLAGGPSTALVEGSSAMTSARGRNSRAHVVSDPQQQEPAGEDKPGDLEQLRRQHGEDNQEDQRHPDAKQEHPLSVARSEPGRERTHDDDIVASHGEVDQ